MSERGDAEAGASARVRLALGLGLLLLAIGLGVRMAGRSNLGDLEVYHRVCARVGSGLDLYSYREGPQPSELTAYIYPPPFALLFYPLTQLPFALVRGLWCALGVLALARCLWLGVEVLRLGGIPRPPPLALGLGALIFLRYAWSDISHGQVNVFVAWLTLEGIAAAEGERDAAAGAWLAAAVTLKLTPAIVVAHYLLRRRWRLIAWGSGCGLALLLLPALAFGFGRNLDYLWRFVSEVTPWNARFHGFVGNNASLPAAAARLLAGSADAGQPPRPLLGSLAPASALLVGRAISATFLVAALALAQRARSPRSLALVLAATPLVSPIAWKPHLVVLILPGLLAGRLLLEPGRHRLPLAGGLIAAGLASRLLLGRELANAWILWGGTSAGLLLLFAGLALAPDLEEEAPRSASATSPSSDPPTKAAPPSP